MPELPTEGEWWDYELAVHGRESEWNGADTNASAMDHTSTSSHSMFDQLLVVQFRLKSFRVPLAFLRLQWHLATCKSATNWRLRKDLHIAIICALVDQFIATWQQGVSPPPPVRSPYPSTQSCEHFARDVTGPKRASRIINTYSTFSSTFTTLVLKATAAVEVPTGLPPDSSVVSNTAGNCFASIKDSKDPKPNPTVYDENNEANGFSPTSRDPSEPSIACFRFDRSSSTPQLTPRKTLAELKSVPYLTLSTWNSGERCANQRLHWMRQATNSCKLSPSLTLTSYTGSSAISSLGLNTNSATSVSCPSRMTKSSVPNAIAQGASFATPNNVGFPLHAAASTMTCKTTGIHCREPDFIAEDTALLTLRRLVEAHCRRDLERWLCGFSFSDVFTEYSEGFGLSWSRSEIWHAGPWGRRPPSCSYRTVTARPYAWPAV